MKLTHSSSAPTAGVLMAILFTHALAVSPATPLRIKSTPADPTISRLANEELIERLQEETQLHLTDSSGNSRTISPALADGFLPVDAAMAGQENLVRAPQSPIMTELVRRGFAALPALIAHLEDARPTGLSIAGVVIGLIGFGDQFDARYPASDRQPLGVNTVDNSGENHLAPGTRHTLKIGDLCYGAVGKIVNRWLLTVGSRTGHVSTINSPIIYPQLARAVEADWGRLTAKEHEQSLRDDILERDDRGHPGTHSMSAVRKIMFYYPDAGRELIEKMLQRTLVDGETDRAVSADKVTYLDQSRLLAKLAPIEWEGLDAALLGIYRTIALHRPSTLQGRFYRDNLAFACARRLVGKGFDTELGEFFSARRAEK